MTSEFMNLLAAYFLCNATAEVRMLDVHEAQQCLVWQTAIKIELLPHVTPGDYTAMTSAERAAFGREGYRAYLAWKAEHSDLVADLTTTARQQAEAAQARSH